MRYPIADSDKLVPWTTLPPVPVTIVVPMIVPVVVTAVMIMIRSNVFAVVSAAPVIAMLGRNHAPAKQRNGRDKQQKNGPHRALLSNLRLFRA
jgi:hypothetical protein